MKYFTIVKYHPCVQLAHTYEHLFVSTATEYLYQHNRYKLLDYSLNGETYESGVIVINGECYNAESEKILNNITAMKADLGSEKSGYLPVAQAISQIGAEEPNMLYIGNPERVIKELKKLNTKSWKSIDSVSLLPDTKAANEDIVDLIYTTNQLSNVNSPLELNIEIKDQPMGICALWYELARFIGLSVGQKICHNFSTYFSGEHVNNDGATMTYTATFSVNRHSQPEISLEEVTLLSRKTINEIITPNVLMRFSTYLSSVSYSHNPHFAPDISYIAQNIGMLVGSQGWKNISTPDNMKKILQTVSYNLHCGNSSIDL